MNKYIFVLPAALVALRTALAPALVLLAFFAPVRAALGACLAAAFLSDVFDGIVARRLAIATAALRRLDTAADTLFYAAAAFAVWKLHPAVILARLPPLAVLLALELLRYAFDYAKFRREASYHLWSSKAWGVALFAAFFAVLTIGIDGWLVDVAIYAGIFADLEGIAVSLILPAWHHDVPSVVHAWRIRRAETG